MSAEEGRTDRNIRDDWLNAGTLPPRMAPAHVAREWAMLCSPMKSVLLRPSKMSDCLKLLLRWKAPVLLPG